MLGFMLELKWKQACVCVCVSAREGALSRATILGTLCTCMGHNLLLDWNNFYWHFKCSILGWPKVAVLTLPMDKIITQLLTIVSGYLLPIFISCALYVSLICIKQRNFINQVNFTKEPEEVSSVCADQGNQNVVLL